MGTRPENPLERSAARCYAAWEEARDGWLIVSCVQCVVSAADSQLQSHCCNALAAIHMSVSRLADWLVAAWQALPSAGQ